jgi:Pin2-interacting protein X1
LNIARELFILFMGLSGRKTKQRIPDDPRNLCWADGKGVLITLIFLLNRLFSSLIDAARFGSNYLAKFGWDGSTGLGAAGDGRKSHIKVSHKLDLLGIGAAQQKDPDGIAWKQNEDFERLLQRLNVEAVTAESNQSLESGMKEEEEEVKKDGVTKKKRKHREDGEFKTERKKKRKVDNEGQSSSSSNTESATIQPEKIETTAVKKAVIVPRHRAQVKSLSFVALYMLIYQQLF